MSLKSIVFWQPRFDFLKFFEKFTLGKYLVIILNYLIWFFLFYISFLLIKFSTNIFWQILIATIISEIVEKYGKSHAFWCRPLYQRNDPTPAGLVDRWYKTGSFPSGHTIKAVYFLFFLIQYPVFPIIDYALVVTPLLFFRVLIGFHYPIDLIGGAILGSLIWLVSHQIVFPVYLTGIIQFVFNFIFHL